MKKKVNFTKFTFFYKEKMIKYNSIYYNENEGKYGEKSNLEDYAHSLFDSSWCGACTYRDILFIQQSIFHQSHQELLLNRDLI